MNLYDSLMEMVMIEDSVDEYMDRREAEAVLESVLSKAGLRKEDLQDPEKVKKALKNLNGITSEYEKRSAIISIITSIIQTINAIISITAKFSTEGKVAQALSILLVQIVSEIAKYQLGVSDYRKLLNKIDNEIKKVSNQIAKLNKADNPDKAKIKQLEEIRDNLKRSKAEIIKRMKEENKIEGKKEEPINPEAQNPMAAFTGMLTN